MLIGIVHRDRGRIVKTISKKFEVYELKLPHLPDVIEEKIEFPKELRDCDVVLCYARHYNFNTDLVEFLDGYVDFIVVAGKFKIKAESSNLIIDDACCSIARNDNEFFNCFGFPKFEVEVDNGKVERIKVLRNSPCNAGYEVSKAVVGLKVEDALSKAGLVAQLNCLGDRDAIHKAGKIHSLALKRALDRI
ncbi:DUF166 family protein [Archaeoglobus sp.]